MRTVLLAGLTGGIGAGKSTVADMLVARGAVLVDGDRVAREVVEPGRPALERIAERFGTGVLDAEGRLDRPALAAVAFATEHARKDLEAITHPAIQAEFARRVLEAAPDAIVVLDVPLLVESEKANERGYHCVIVVEAPRDLRLDRLEGRGIARADAEARMAAQSTDEERREIATWVLVNDGDRDHLERQVETVWAELVARNAGLSDP
jgi:dephospho-CoA kinase